MTGLVKLRRGIGVVGGRQLWADHVDNDFNVAAVHMLGREDCITDKFEANDGRKRSLRAHRRLLRVSGVLLPRGPERTGVLALFSVRSLRQRSKRAGDRSPALTAA